MRLSDKNNSSPIPFRDSKLTRVLRTALESNTKVVIICNISPSSEAFEETLSTLKFAQRAKKVKQIVAKNDTTGTKMLILRYETEIVQLQEKLKVMEAKVVVDFQAVELKEEIGVIKERLHQEISDKARLSEAFEQALLDRSQLEAEISRLKSRILVSENMKVDVLEPELGQSVPLDRRIHRLTIARDSAEDYDRQRTVSVWAMDQQEFFRKAMDSPEEAMNLGRTITEIDSQADYSQNYSVRDTRLFEKISTVDELFEGFNPRFSMMTSATGVRDSMLLSGSFDVRDREEEAGMPSREQLMWMVAEQEKLINCLQKDTQEKGDQIELLKDELNLCRINLKGMQQQLKEIKKEKGTGVFK